MEFHLSGSCHYHLADRQLTDLTVENVRLLITEPDGSVRAAKGSYVSLSAHIYAGGPPPVLPNRETMELASPTHATQSSNHLARI